MIDAGFSPLRPNLRFFGTTPPLAVVDAVRLAGAEIVRADGRAQREVTHAAPLTRGGTGAVIFAQNPRAMAADLLGDPALVFVVSSGVERAAALFPDATIAVSPVPKAAFASVARALHFSLMDHGHQTDQIAPDATVAPTAQVAATAVVMAGAAIGEQARIGPFAVIGPGTTIGAHSQIGSHCTITHAEIGEHCAIFAGARIGEAGFGYVNDGTSTQPMPQLGAVRIADHVDIGANCAIDRGALEDTIIGSGTKFDNMVQIAHNCRIGKSVLIASQTGVSGSCTIGDGVMIGGQVGVAEHLNIGAGALITAKSGLMKDVPAGERWGGMPAKPAREWMKEVAAVSRLARIKGKSS